MVLKSKAQFSFQAVNKTFRNVCNGMNRKFYRTLNIAHDCRGQYSEVFFGKLYINDEEVKIQHLYKFFEYLINVCRITVKEVRIKNEFY
ncbi:hypothetical protein B9Z55_011123 [Caenorhabditis nigoni]|uniref:Uncharacterized protein n=1 Tax=Caenorhabditis nigoni TaxID=1611254 RepID=A0A2G5UJM8_9PELO|nr:hypothetical protein B9Z55_011123 [Caenorhabditis nigoni]